MMSRASFLMAGSSVGSSPGSDVSSPSSASSSPSKPNKKFWGEDKGNDAIYSVFLKKIMYSAPVPIGLSDSSSESDLVEGITRMGFNRRGSNLDKVNGHLNHLTHNGINGHTLTGLKKTARSASVSVTKPLLQNHRSSSLSGSTSSSASSTTSSVDSNPSNELYRYRDSPFEVHSVQSLQWETRQIRILKAGTLEHIIQYILFVTTRQIDLSGASTNGGRLMDLTMDTTDNLLDQCQSIVMEEERNNVSHAIHLLFISYRLVSSPIKLFHLMHHQFITHIKSYPNLNRQFNFILLYWMSNFPEDFLSISTNEKELIMTPLIKSIPSTPSLCTTSHPTEDLKSLPHEVNDDGVKSRRSKSKRTKSSSRGERDSSRNNPGPNSQPTNGHHNGHHGHHHVHKNRRSSSSSNCDRHQLHRLVDHLLSVPRIDDVVVRKALSIMQDAKLNPAVIGAPSSPTVDALEGNGVGTKSTSPSTLTELESRFIAQQLTAIDIETFLGLKPYHLLEGTRSNAKVQNTIKNFNQLSRQVIISILKSPTPDIITGHWIDVCLHLRRMKNFNSLKAVIAGLTNESIYRLKGTVWSKLNRTAVTHFKTLSSVVDDVNNQSVLRQTQLEVEGTSKVSMHEMDLSFGTIPYLGTFFTDLNIVDTRFTNQVESNDGTKLINLEKWSKQFEVITQVQLLQKNVKAALTAYHTVQHMNAMNGHTPFTSTTPSSTPLSATSSSASSGVQTAAIPRVARIFRNWFTDNNLLTDNECYKLSLELEAPSPKK